MWWKRNRRKLIAPILVAAVLAAAFWYGGDAPGLRGWTTGRAQTGETSTAGPEETADPAQSEIPDGPGTSAGEAPEDTGPSDDTPADTSESDTSAPGDSEPPAAPDTGKDSYQTDPVPDGKPLPVEPQESAVTDTAYTCTLSISCATILDNMDWLDPEKAELVPEDGWILKPTVVTFYQGESVFNVLQRTCKQQKILMEFENTPMYNSAYIEGIHNLYELDCGERSGWMYKVNDWFPNYGCSRYQLQDGDTVCWVYTCDLGADVGGDLSTNR